MALVRRLEARRPTHGGLGIGPHGEGRPAVTDRRPLTKTRGGGGEAAARERERKGGRGADRGGEASGVVAMLCWRGQGIREVVVVVRWRGQGVRVVVVVVRLRGQGIRVVVVVMRWRGQGGGVGGDGRHEPLRTVRRCGHGGRLATRVGFHRQTPGQGNGVVVMGATNRVVRDERYGTREAIESLNGV